MSDPEPIPNLTSGRLLARNTMWNLVGQMLPMVVAVAAAPPLVRALGIPRFGVLTLAWLVIGYFSLFDLGMGRALTKLVADKLATDEEHSIPSMVWTSLLLMSLLGTMGGLGTFAISPWLVQRALKVPPELRVETLRTFYLLALSIPVVTVTSGLRGILEARQRFRVLTLIRIPLSIFSVAGPLLVLPFSHSLVPAIVVLVAGRLVGCALHWVACVRSFPALRNSVIFERSLLRPVVRLGGWMTVTNIVGPIMTYLDRFLIGALLSVSEVAYYTVPMDLVSRLTMIPGALVNVLFPAFAASLAQDPARTGLILSRGLKYTYLSVLPIIFIIVVFAPEGLTLWLGPVFAHNAATVLRVLAVGIFINCLSMLPMALIQGAGMPDISAKLNLLELPFYLVAVWVLTKRLGIEGTAIAWAVRVALDAAFLFIYAHRLLPHQARFLGKLAVMVAAGLLLLYAATFPETLLTKVVIVVPTILILTLAGWRWGLGPSERSYLIGSRSNLPPQITRV